MAEFAASIVAFIQVTDSVIRVCSQIIGSAKDAPRDMVIISGEVTAVRAILTCFAETKLHPKTEEALPTLFAASGPIQACYRSIAALERLLPKLPTERRGTSLRMADFGWALKEGQVRKLLAEISLHKSTLLLALTGDMMRDIKDIKAGVNRVEEALSRTERNEALNWLQSKCYNPSTMHHSIWKNHEEHTNSWLHRWEDWHTWLQPDSDVERWKIPPVRFIWIHGIPGAGKSVMASFIIESIKQHCKPRVYYDHELTRVTSNTRLGHAYYYCHYSQKEDAGLPFLRWIVGQLCRQAEWAPQQLKRLQDSGYDPTTEEALEILEAVLGRFDTVYLVIDGVDESEPRTELLDILIQLATQHERFSKIRLLATSRMHHDIEHAFVDISAGISMSNKYVEEDIRTVVHEWVTTSPRMVRWRHLAGLIEERLVVGAEGMFRWAACQMHYVERLRQESQLLQTLADLPKDLYEIYARSLERIAEVDDDCLFVRRALLWIAGHASSGRLRNQGIHIDLLVSAVCDDLKHMTGKDWLYTVEDLKELCGCLITIKQAPLPFTDFLAELEVVQPNNSGTLPGTEEEGVFIYRKEDPDYLNGDDPPPEGEFVKIAHYTVIEFLASERLRTATASSSGNSIQQFSLTVDEIQHEFFRSVLRQALAADPAGTSADWVRDREPYCLTLAPLIMAGKPECARPVAMELCIPFFLPTRPHFSRLRLVQSYLAAGCWDAQSFFAARLPIHDPTIPSVAYSDNDPNLWALAGMLLTNCDVVAAMFLASLGWKYEKLAHDERRTIVASFLDGRYNTLDNARGSRAAVVRTYRGTLADVLEARYR